jgi:hypothetical protein
VFIDVATLARGREIVRQLPPEFEAFLARGLNDSPLLARSAAG